MEWCEGENISEYIGSPKFNVRLNPYKEVYVACI